MRRRKPESYKERQRGERGRAKSGFRAEGREGVGEERKSLVFKLIEWVGSAKSVNDLRFGF